jgi:hypothetical protein
MRHDDLEKLAAAAPAEILEWTGREPWAREMARCQQDAAWHAEGAEPFKRRIEQTAVDDHFRTMPMIQDVARKSIARSCCSPHCFMTLAKHPRLLLIR